ncbi:MAG: vitamin B12-dependent ribonucleotide reductase [Candidatus Latescibacteria bacterium]|nr:vitamin B12-dependent ribonucleotide reductase [Candidatus Latescibacterota bacterium]
MASKTGKSKKKKISLSFNAKRILERRYLRKDEAGKVIETAEELFRRVAKNIASAEKLYGDASDVKKAEEEFYGIMTRLDYLPNSPTLMNAGGKLQQLAACFVIPIEDSMESIFEAIKNTALIHKSGGGTGFSFSRIRPKNALVQDTGGVASGPLSFMEVFNAATETVKQGGKRRGANMGILRVDHPDILDFIDVKRDLTKLNNFNLSVALTEKFMKALEADEEYELIAPHTQQAVGTLGAREVFDRIVDRAWTSGDPGIIFIDRMNEYNPTPHIGTYESTNPCGEQILLGNESCNLGSINLSNMVADGKVDFGHLARTVKSAVHFLDNVIDVNRFPLPEIERMTKANRKIGLGVMGFADLLVKLRISYNSERAVGMAEKVMAFIQEKGREASTALAEKRGTFPNFKGSVFDKPGGQLMRNATVTTIAPTGTISIIAGCSSGVEPNFAWKTTRRDSFGEVELLHPLYEEWTTAHPDEALPDYFVSAHEITPEWHLRIQAAYQKYTDNAVSKTVNFPNSATRDDVREAYMLAYKLGCKGVTIYRDGSRDLQVLSVSKSSRGEEKAGKEKTEGAALREPRPRPQITRGKTIKMKTGCGKLYVTINEDEEGLCEVFSTMGKAGGCTSSQSEAISRLISTGLRSGISVDAIVQQLSGISCPLPVWQNGVHILSCADAIAKAIQLYMNEKADGNSTPKMKANELEEMPGRRPGGTCPECGGMTEYVEGCVVCRSCGFSRCD